MTQVQSVVSRNVNPIEGAVVTFGLSKPEQPTMSSQTQPFTWNYSGFDTGHESLGAKSGSKQLQKELQQPLIWKSKWNSNKVDTCLLENNPALARELMDFFEEKEGIELIDIEPAMTGEDFGYLLSKVDGVMFWLGIDSPYALHHPQMNPYGRSISYWGGCGL